MGLTSNIPHGARCPSSRFHGTRGQERALYTMERIRVDAWRDARRPVGATPVTTYEASPLRPGQVTQATWRGGIGGAQVAFVTIIGGGHEYATAGQLHRLRLHRRHVGLLQPVPHQHTGHPEDRLAAGEQHPDQRPARELLGRRHGQSALNLPVAEERRGYPGRDRKLVHDAGHDPGRQRRDLPGGRQQRFWQRHEHRRDLDRKRRPADPKITDAADGSDR